MNTKTEIEENGSVDKEIAEYNSEILVGNSVVNGSRDRYASELGNSETIEMMRMQARLQPKRYSYPKKDKVRFRLSEFLDRIMITFGLNDEAR